MNGIFGYDSWLGGKIYKMTDFFCLFFLWVLFSIPIVTIGASTCAFYYTFSKVLIKERGSIRSSFIKSFKENFKQTTGVFLLHIVVCSILVLNSYYTFILKGVFNDILSWVFFGNAVILYIWTKYWFPYISFIEDNTRTVLKNCWIIMVENIHWSLVILALLALMLLLMYFCPGVLLLLSVVYMALDGLIFNRIFKKYMPPETEDDDRKVEFVDNEGIDVVEE